MRHPARETRPAFTLIEILVVMGILALILVIAAGLLLGAFQTERASAGVYRRLHAQALLADQFRDDVAGAVAAPETVDQHKAGPACLILRMADGSHVIYRWDADHLERAVRVGTAETSRKLPVGGRGVRAELARSGGIVTLRLIEGHDHSDVKRQLDIAAALGGDRR
jgi:prepilin-type N-terminal cleavage/methylation domain-containing protein